MSNTINMACEMAGGTIEDVYNAPKDGVDWNIVWRIISRSGLWTE